jgi:hypothetical protein
MMSDLGKSLRTALLCEIIQVYWNKEYPNREMSKAKLVEVYYDKAMIFQSMGYVHEVLQNIEFIDQRMFRAN